MNIDAVAGYIEHNGKAAQTAGADTGNGTFKEIVRRLKAQETVPEGRLAEEAGDRMSMDEYMEYIYEKVNAMTVNSSLENTHISIFISREAFLRMKEDYAYEQQILSMIGRDLNAFIPYGLAPEYYVIEVGKGTEDYAVSASGREEKLCRGREEDSYWEQKARRKRKADRELKKIIIKKQAERAYLNKLAGERHIARRVREQALNEAASRMRAGFQVNSVEVAMAGRAYKTHYDKRELDKMN